MSAIPKQLLRPKPRCPVSDARRPSIYSIPACRDFADSLAEGIIDQFGSSTMGLAQGIVLVPSNRGAIAIQDAFVRRSEKGLLLPRLVPIGDPDLGEHIGAALDSIDSEPIPPAVDPLERQLILARLLQQKGKTGAGQGAQAMRLAADLGRVLDQLAVERVSPARLREIDHGTLSDHWQASLDLLEVILDAWPRELERLGKTDLSERRNQQLDRLAVRWRTTPPPGFVVAAGISTTAPAIADLLREIARLPSGQVVFAGLDLDMPNEQWEAIGDGEETHPQHQLHRLVTAMGAGRGEVGLWRWGDEARDRRLRSSRVAHALAPAQFTNAWVALDDRSRTLPGLSAMELANPGEEAQAIALALRAFIETPGQTAALITPDRGLAERVSSHLTRWGVVADDSAGQPLSHTQPGALMIALAVAVVEHFTAVPLLALLKHPLVSSGEMRLDWLDGVRSLDLALRGPQAAPGLAGIDTMLAHGDKRTQAVRDKAAAWWQEARPLLEPLESAFAGESLSHMVAALREAATRLCGDQIWSGQAGRALADLVASLERHSADEPVKVDVAALPDLLRNLLDGEAIRPAAGGHPRLFIWGLVEARMQRADLIVLAGLNEGVWPQLARSDPWLAPAIRRELGLPGLERRIGVNAHDLMMGLCAKRVMITRARTDGSGPTNPSRFWLRLETFANGFEAPGLRYDLLARALDHAEGQRARQPAPCPPVEDRPNKISVTEVDTLKADPYSFYAKKMLGLTQLDAPGAEPDAKWRGTFLHDVLGAWGNDDKFAPGMLVPRLRAAFRDSGLHPVVQALWLPRFEQAARNFEAIVEANRTQGREPTLAEADAVIDVAGVRLHGRADRIDRLADGTLAIVDYKTGKPPEPKQLKNGYALQLGLLGMLAEAGRFEGAQATAAEFEYWSQGRKSGGEFGYVWSTSQARGANRIEASDFVADLYQHFEQAVETWLTGCAPFTAKLHPDYAWTEFDHLMRYDEWQGRDGT